MNDYMRENKIDAVVPQVAAATPKGGKPAEDDATPAASAEDKLKGKSARGSDGADSQAHSEEPKQSKGGGRSAKHG